MRVPLTGPDNTDPLYFSFLNSPLGLIGLVASEKGLCEIRTKVSSESAFLKHIKMAYPMPPSRNSQKLSPHIKQLKEYFEGKRTEFTCPLDLNQGTAFQQKVWKALLKIPFGQTRSYSWLAKEVGNPPAVRAVGGANGKNPIPIIVPCHRVIRKDGSLGGYTGGLDKKRVLHRLEGI